MLYLQDEGAAGGMSCKRCRCHLSLYRRRAGECYKKKSTESNRALFFLAEEELRQTSLHRGVTACAAVTETEGATGAEGNIWSKENNFRNVYNPTTLQEAARSVFEWNCRMGTRTQRSHCTYCWYDTWSFKEYCRSRFRVTRHRASRRRRADERKQILKIMDVRMKEKWMRDGERWGGKRAEVFLFHPGRWDRTTQGSSSPS